MPETGLEPLAALERLGVALLIGFLIGLDRERAGERKHRHEFAGVRTFPLIALAGCVPMLFLDEARLVLLGISFLAVVVVTLISYRRHVAQGHIGATTEVGAIGTFLLGALAGAGELLIAAVAGIAIAVLLVAKPKLRAFSRALTPREIHAALELAVLSVIILPLLPDQNYGPGALKVLNPRGIWLVVVLVSALSFVGFIAVRLFGERWGLTITGAVGGLVSSTAVTLAMAERSRAGGAALRPATAAAVLASAIMAARVVFLAGVINISLVPRLLAPVAAILLAGVTVAWLLARSAPPASNAGGHAMQNPFSIWAALTFGAIYAVVVLVVNAAKMFLGDAGVYSAAAISALVDLDAVTIAFARMGPIDGGWRLPAAAITLAIVINNIVKLGIGLARGHRDYKRGLALGLVSMSIAAIVAGTLVYLYWPEAGQVAAAE